MQAPLKAAVPRRPGARGGHADRRRRARRQRRGLPGPHRPRRSPRPACTRRPAATARQLCSGDMLLEALVACAGVTLRAVATVAGARRRAARCTPRATWTSAARSASTSEAPVGFRDIRLDLRPRHRRADADQVADADQADRAVLRRPADDPPVADDVGARDTVNGAHSLLATLVDAGGGRVLRQPRHVGDALRRRARRRARDAAGARPVRRRRHRRRRRLRADGGQARRRAAAPGPGPRQRPCQPAQRPPGGPPIVNVVGEHATDHQQLRRPAAVRHRRRRGHRCRAWLRTSASTAGRGPRRRRRRGAAARAGQVATLVLPADASLVRRRRAAPRRAPRPPAHADPRRCRPAADALRSGEPRALLLGGDACRADGLAAASRIAAATGRGCSAETFPARLERGAGLPAVERFGYVVEQAQHQLAGVRHLVLLGARAPVAFFAYPGKPAPSCPTARRCTRSPQFGEAAAAARSSLADLVARRHGTRRSRPPRDPSSPPARSRSRTPPPWSGRCCRRAPWSSTRPTRPGSGCLRATAGAPPPRLAHPHRRRDRLRPARRHGRRGGLPGSARLVPAGRRQRDVHDLRAVVARPGGPRRHDRRLQQQRLRHPARRAAAGRRGGLRRR